VNRKSICETSFGCRTVEELSLLVTTQQLIVLAAVAMIQTGHTLMALRLRPLLSRLVPRKFDRWIEVHSVVSQ